MHAVHSLLYVFFFLIFFIIFDYFFLIIKSHYLFDCLSRVHFLLFIGPCTDNGMIISIAAIWYVLQLSFC